MPQVLYYSSRIYIYFYIKNEESEVYAYTHKTCHAHLTGVVLVRVTNPQPVPVPVCTRDLNPWHSLLFLHESTLLMTHVLNYLKPRLVDQPSSLASLFNRPTCLYCSLTEHSQTLRQYLAIAAESSEAKLLTNRTNEPMIEEGPN